MRRRFAVVTSRPNIVLIMSDQHRADMLGCAGDVAVHTPRLDRLAADALRFSRVSCQGPLCMPARASFLTERYVRDHGVYTNWAEVPSGWPTYVHALQAAGYHTTMLGKAHLTRDDDIEVSHVDELAGRLHERGFTEVIESGDKFTTQVANRYTDHLEKRGLLAAYRQHLADRSYHGEHERGQGATKRVSMWDATPSPVPLEDYIDTWHGDQTVRWIEQYHRADPFFLFVGFPGPHDPWDAPREAVERYGPASPTPPSSVRRPDLEHTGAYGKLLGGMLQLSDTDTMTDDAISGMRRAYCANVSVIDEAVGRIIDALTDRGLLDDTWIIYTSDHGEMGGNHSMMSKCVLYEPAVRVPLIVRPPGGCSRQVIDELVEHIDVPATVRAIAGAAPVVESDGRSLLGHLDGTAPEARSVSISENWGFASFETEGHRLVVDEDRFTPCQLFDLAADPSEDDNLVVDLNHSDVLDEMMATVVATFLAIPAGRPHRSPFA